jgi:ornithine--oxo-acid transaminase
LNILVEDDLPACSASMGDYMLGELRKLDSPLIKEIRGIGLFVGLEIDPALGTAREVCERLMRRGILSKETHDTVVRLAPPLTIGRSEIDWALTRIGEVLTDMDDTALAS